MKILAGYLAVINICGLVIMVLGKKCSSKKNRLLLTRAIWIIAAAGGSIGTIAGMYLVHFKDRKLRYVIGLPLILLAQLLLILCGRSYLKERSARPSSVVDRQLSHIQNLDAEATMQIISYENLVAPETEIASSEAGRFTEEAISAVTGFFKDFHYRIDGTEINGDKASVKVTITNIDARALAQDVCRALTRQSAQNLEGKSASMDGSDYYRLLTDTIENGDYEMVSREISVPMTLEGQTWTIVTDERFQDDLLGGFVTAINDRYLVKPEEILTIYLDRFSQMDGPSWLQYLNRTDIFSTYSANYSSQLDNLYTEKIAEYFSCSVDSCTQEDDTAAASVTVTSVDLAHVFDAYRTKLLAYAGSTESITSSNAELADATAKYLIEAFDEASQSAVSHTEIKLTNDGRTWNPVFDKDITNLFLGDINGALENFIKEQETEITG